MTTRQRLLREIYDIITEDLDANYGITDHIEYLDYRLSGGNKTEAEWFKSNC